MISELRDFQARKKSEKSDSGIASILLRVFPSKPKSIHIETGCRDALKTLIDRSVLVRSSFFFGWSSQVLQNLSQITIPSSLSVSSKSTLCRCRFKVSIQKTVSDKMKSTVSLTWGTYVRVMRRGGKMNVWIKQGSQGKMDHYKKTSENSYVYSLKLYVKTSLAKSNIAS